MSGHTFSRLGPTPAIAPGCKLADGVLVVLCECGCNHFRICFTGHGDRAFAMIGLTIEQGEAIARRMLADAEVARAAIKHGGVGHA